MRRSGASHAIAEKRRLETYALLSDSLLLPSQEHSVELADVRTALRALPIEQAEVLHLVGVLGSTYSASAEILGVPSGAIMSRLSRARAALRDRLEGPAIGRGLILDWLEVVVDPGNGISEDEINAFLDGELSPPRGPMFRLDWHATRK